MPWRVIALVLICGVVATRSFAQQNRIDVVSPLAPELAPYGPYAIGVRTIEATDHHRVDVLATTEGGPIARSDRTLTLEVWYPARLAAGQHPAATTARSRATPRSRRRCTVRPSAMPSRSRSTVHLRSSSCRTAIRATAI